MTNPKCPDCGERLVKISGTDKEYICANEDCPANKQRREVMLFTHAEYYGTQKEINEQKYVNSKEEE